MRTAISAIVQAAHDSGWTETVSPYARHGIDTTRFTRGTRVIDVVWTSQGRVSSADIWIDGGRALLFVAYARSAGKRAAVLSWLAESIDGEGK